MRPWNGKETKNRDDGKYYTKNFRSALISLPEIITITSYNEWHEGTQIEGATSHDRGHGKMYLEYGEGKENTYMELTKELIETMPDTPKSDWYCSSAGTANYLDASQNHTTSLLLFYTYAKYY